MKGANQGRVEWKHTCGGREIRKVCECSIRMRVSRWGERGRGDGERGITGRCFVLLCCWPCHEQLPDREEAGEVPAFEQEVQQLAANSLLSS